jgi:hypothetical protein
MRTASTLLVIFAFLGVQLLILWQMQMTLAVRPIASPVMSTMSEVQVAEIERRAAQVEARLREIQESLKDRPIVRRVETELPAGRAWALADYKKWVVVIVGPKATAVVEFTDEIENGVGYRFRCLEQGQRAEQVGEGKVFEKYRTLPGEKPGNTLLIDDGGQLFVQAGAIRVEWSYAGPGQGCIYYDPLSTRVYLVQPGKYATLDLSRFGR